MKLVIASVFVCTLALASLVHAAEPVRAKANFISRSGKATLFADNQAIIKADSDARVAHEKESHSQVAAINAESVKAFQKSYLAKAKHKTKAPKKPAAIIEHSYNAARMYRLDPGRRA